METEPAAAPEPELANIETKDVLEHILATYPSKLAGLDAGIMTARRLEMKLKERLDNTETELAGKIAMDKVDGKPRFGNEASRAMQLQQSLHAHAEYKAVKSEYWDQGARILEITRYRNRVEEELKSARLLVLSRSKLRLELIL